MSKTSKTVLWIVLVVVVLGLIGWVYANQHPMNTADNTANSASALQATTLSSGNSNDDLNQDMTKVDAQMQGLNQDSAAVNQDSQ